MAPNYKRSLTGQFHHVTAKYLQESLDEFAFIAWNRNRKEKLMNMVLASCAG